MSSMDVSALIDSATSVDTSTSTPATPETTSTPETTEIETGTGEVTPGTTEGNGEVPETEQTPEQKAEAAKAAATSAKGVTQQGMRSAVKSLKALVDSANPADAAQIKAALNQLHN